LNSAMSKIYVITCFFLMTKIFIMIIWKQIPFKIFSQHICDCQEYINTFAFLGRVDWDI
jgi:hypothetical protein